MLSLTASASVPRLILNGFVAAAGGGQQSTHIATGWSMGFPVGGVSVSDSGDVSLTAEYWYKVKLAVPPPPPSIIEPTAVLEGQTGNYESEDYPLEITGLKPPKVNYGYNAMVIGYTNGIELPATAINQVSNQSVWSLDLYLGDGEEIELALASSNIFGFSENKTILNITQIPEPLLFLFLPLLLLFTRKRFFKFNVLILLVFILLYSSNGRAVEFNYQGIVAIEDGVYTGDGYFKFTISDKNGTTNYWANDGTLMGEPVASVKIGVSNGFFHTTLGGNAMLPIPRSLFAGTNKLYLTVWFGHLPVQNLDKLGPPQEIISVPLAFNSDLLDGHDYDDIIYNIQTNTADLYLLKTGDVCSGELQVSNLVSDTDVKLSGDIIVEEEKKIYLNGNSKSAYISAKPDGNITIYKNNKPVFEIE